MKIFKYIIYFITTFILLFIITINIFNNKSILGYRSFIIMSGSMEDTLNINDLIIVKKIDKNKLKEKDIISFYSGGSIVTHRINKIIKSNNKTLYQTKGDNNNTIDKELVNYKDIIGKCIFIIPSVGKFIFFIKKYLILIILGFIIINFILYNK